MEIDSKIFFENQEPNKNQLEQILFIKRIIWLTIILACIQTIFIKLTTSCGGASYFNIYSCFEIPLIICLLSTKNVIVGTGRVGGINWFGAVLFLSLISGAIFFLLDLPLTPSDLIPMLVFIIRIYALWKIIRLVYK